MSRITIIEKVIGLLVALSSIYYLMLGASSLMILLIIPKIPGVYSKIMLIYFTLGNFTVPLLLLISSILLLKEYSSKITLLVVINIINIVIMIIVSQYYDSHNTLEQMDDKTSVLIIIKEFAVPIIGNALLLLPFIYRKVFAVK